MDERLTWRIQLSERMHARAKALAAQGGGSHDHILIEQVVDDLMEHCWPHDREWVDRCVGIRLAARSGLRSGVLSRRLFPHALLTASIALMCLVGSWFAVSSHTTEGTLLGVALVVASFLLSVCCLWLLGIDGGEFSVAPHRAEDFAHRVDFYIHSAIAGYHAIIEDERPELFPAGDR